MFKHPPCLYDGHIYLNDFSSANLPLILPPLCQHFTALFSNDASSSKKIIVSVFYSISPQKSEFLSFKLLGVVRDSSATNLRKS